jgi:hypothetical protein
LAQAYHDLAKRSINRVDRFPDTVRFGEYALMQRHRRFDSINDIGFKRAPHPCYRHLAGAVMNDEFGDQRIVVRRNKPSRIRRGVNAHAGPAGQVHCGDQSRRGYVGEWRLGVYSALYRMAVEDNVFLIELKPLSRCNQNLFAHQVGVRHELGYRMLDLNAGVHLHKIEVVILIQQKLHRTRVNVPYFSTGAHSQFPHFTAHLGAECRRWRFFDQLLMPALNRTLALSQVDEVAVLIAQDLNLYMAGGLDVLFEVDRWIAEGE